jgi:small-conductance mechanosensitive channel
MMIYPYIPGSSTAAFKGIGLFAGALFTLGASGAASSLIGGLTLIFTDVFRVGDRIQVGEVTGDVVEVTLFITRLRTPKNEIVTLANGGVLSSRIVNYSSEARKRGLILHTSVTIGYDAPWRRVHELLVQAAKATPGIEESPEPFVLQTSLDDFYVSYQLNAYSRDPNAMAATYSALHQNIQDTFHQGGVEIMSPHFRALRDGSAAAIPPEPDGQPTGEPRPFAVRVEPAAGT